MSKKYVIVSQVCDKFIANNRPDIEFLMFRDLEELLGFVEREYLDADMLYVTRDAVMPNYTNKLSILLNITKSPMFSIDSIVYMADERDCEELAIVESIKLSHNLDNWSYVKGPMNKEYVTSYICGSLSTDDINPVRKAVIRKKKKQYVREKLLHEEEMISSYKTEEVLLSNVELEEDEQTKEVDLLPNKDVCSLLNVTGLNKLERTLFAFLLAQYCSRKSKTIIIEKDFEYLRLSDIVSRTNMKLMNITVQELYSDVTNVLKAIRECDEKLITITSDTRSKYPYQFICNLLYTNLKDVVEYIVVEHELTEVPLMSHYTVVVPSNVCDIMETIDKFPESYKEFADIAVVNISTVDDLCINSSVAVSKVLQEYLSYDKKLDIPIYNIKSLILGEDCHDLYRYMQVR